MSTQEQQWQCLEREDWERLERPQEYYVAWEERKEARTLSWATRLARQKLRLGREGVAIMRRTHIRWQDGRWVWREEIVQDAWPDDDR
jgi:hypothetical protein